MNDTAEKVANYITLIIIIALLIGIVYGLYCGYNYLTVRRAEQLVQQEERIKQYQMEIDRNKQNEKASKNIIKKEEEKDSGIDTTTLIILNEAAFVAGCL